MVALNFFSSSLNNSPQDQQTSGLTRRKVGRIKQLITSSSTLCILRAKLLLPRGQADFLRARGYTFSSYFRWVGGWEKDVITSPPNLFLKCCFPSISYVREWQGTSHIRLVFLKPETHLISLFFHWHGVWTPWMFDSNKTGFGVTCSPLTMACLFLILWNFRAAFEYRNYMLQPDNRWIPESQGKCTI